MSFSIDNLGFKAICTVYYTIVYMLYRSSVEYDMGVSVECEHQKVGVASMFAQTYPSSLRNKFSSIEILITI